MITWIRQDGEVIACIEGKVRYDLSAIMQRPRLHDLYHNEIKEKPNDKETDKR